MFGIKGRDTFNKPKSSFGEKIQELRTWWIKYFSYILLLLLVLMVGFAGYIWYTYLYDKDVSEQEKQEYIIQKSGTITLKKEKFETIQTELEHRKEVYEAPRQEYKDIFYGNVEIPIENKEEKPIVIEEESQEIQASLFTPVEEDEIVE
jgi:hypothetical protein